MDLAAKFPKVVLLVLKRPKPAAADDPRFMETSYLRARCIVAVIKCYFYPTLRFSTAGWWGGTIHLSILCQIFWNFLLTSTYRAGLITSGALTLTSKCTPKQRSISLLASTEQNAWFREIISGLYIDSIKQYNIPFASTAMARSIVLSITKRTWRLHITHSWSNVIAAFLKRLRI